MIMKTRCPYCQTTFKVTPELLAVAAGNVRCGQCEHVFNGNDYLQTEAAPATENNDDFADELAQLDTAFGSLESSLADFETSLDNLEKQDTFLNSPTQTLETTTQTAAAPAPLHVAPVIVKPSAKATPASEAASSPVYDFSRFDQPVPKPVAAPEPERQTTATDILQAQRDQLLNAQRAQKQNPQNQAQIDIELPPISLDDDVTSPSATKTATSKPQNRNIDDIISSYMQAEPQLTTETQEEELDFGQLIDPDKATGNVDFDESLTPSISAAADRKTRKKAAKPKQEPIELTLLNAKSAESEAVAEPIHPIGSGILAQSPLANRRQKAAKASKWWALIAMALALSLILQIAYVMRYRLVQSELGLQLIASCAQFRVCQLKNNKEFELLSRQLKSTAHNKQVLNLKVVFRNNAKYAQRPPTIVISMSDRNGVQIGYYALKPEEYWQKTLIAPQESVNLNVDFADIRKKSLGFEISLI